jgi:ribonuclease D
VEKVFHASEYDLILMRRDYDWHLNNLFDTMWAARILGYSQMGLAGLLESFFGVSTSKRFQKANWCKRPLSSAELAYAQTDTHYLLSLRDHLAAELKAAGLWEEAEEIFREQTRVRLPDKAFDPDGFWSINGTFDLSPEKQAALRGLYLFRDREAKRRDIPPFKILGERTLLELADKMPGGIGELDEIHGMSPKQQSRYGRAILDVLADARSAEAPKPPPRSPRPPDEILNRYDRLHRWRKTRAQARGVESDVIMPRDALWSIAQSNPRTLEALTDLDAMGPWRLATYGREILRLL